MELSPLAVAEELPSGDVAEPVLEFVDEPMLPFESCEDGKFEESELLPPLRGLIDCCPDPAIFVGSGTVLKS